MICPACDEIFPPEKFGEPRCCPACGAYYEKALKLRASRREAERSAKKMQRPREGRKDKQSASTGSKIDNALRAVISPTVAKPIDGAQYNGRPVYKNDMYCTSCGAVGNSKRYVPGSILIEIVLWLCFLIPGLIYSIWRHSASKKACRTCSMPALIPAGSPYAQKMLKK